MTDYTVNYKARNSNKCINKDDRLFQNQFSSRFPLLNGVETEQNVQAHLKRQPFVKDTFSRLQRCLICSVSCSCSRSSSHLKKSIVVEISDIEELVQMSVVLVDLLGE